MEVIECYGEELVVVLLFIEKKEIEWIENFIIFFLKGVDVFMGIICKIVK